MRGVTCQRECSKGKYQDHQGRNGKYASCRRQGHASQYQAAAKVPADKDCPAGKPVNPHSRHKTEKQVRCPPRGIDQALVKCCSVHRHQNQDGQGHGSYIGAKIGHRGGQPEPYKWRISTKLRCRSNRAVGSDSHLFPHQLFGLQDIDGDSGPRRCATSVGNARSALKRIGALQRQARFRLRMRGLPRVGVHARCRPAPWWPA